MDRPTAVDVGEPASINSERTDDQLHAAYVAGDQAAFEQLYLRHKGPLYRYIKGQLNHAAADDVYQETWRKVIDNADRYVAQGKFASYLFSMAHNAVMDWHRTQQRFVDMADDDRESAEAPDQVADTAELREILMRALKRLPIAQRSAWIMQKESGFSHAELAQICGTSTEGIKSRLRYANTQLKQALERYGR